MAKLICDEQLRLGADLSTAVLGSTEASTLAVPLPSAAVLAGNTGGRKGAAALEAAMAAQAAVGSSGAEQPGMAVDMKEVRRSAADVAAAFQRVAVAFLQQRTRRALQWLKVGALGPNMF